MMATARNVNPASGRFGRTESPESVNRGFISSVLADPFTNTAQLAPEFLRQMGNTGERQASYGQYGHIVARPGL